MKGKSKILILLLASAIFTVFALFGVAATLAATDNWLHVIIPYSGSASTDTLTVTVNNGASGGYEVNVSRTRGDSDFHFASYDLVVYSENGSVEVQKNISFNSMTSGVFSDPIAAAYAYPATESDGTSTISYGNTYVTDFFSLQQANTERLTNPTDPIAIDGAYKNVIVIGDVVVDKSFDFTAPASVHILHSTVTLNADLTFRHAYGGIYGIDASVAGDKLKGGSIVQDDGTLSVVTPNAFFGISDGIVKDGSGVAVESLSVVCSETALTADAARPLVESLLDSATAYIGAFVPARLTHNLNLPAAYAASGVKYSYSAASDSSLTANGTVLRSDVTQSASLNVNITYSGIYSKLLGDSALLTTSVRLDRLVVGTGDKAAADELIAMLGEYLEGGTLQPSGGKYEPMGDADLSVLLARHSALGFASTTLAVNEPSGTTLTGGLLAFPTRIINGAPLVFTATCGDVSSTKQYNLAGMTTGEATAYLETLIYTPEFASVGASYDYITKADDGLRRGGARVSSTLGVVNAAVKAIAMTDDELADLQNITSEMWDGWSTDANAFADDGSALTVINLASNTNYVIVQKFEIDPDLSETTTANEIYYTYRVALVPDAGVGGNDTTQYIAGDTFADFYTRLDNGRLLESEIYEFSVNSTGVGIYPVLEGDNVSDYCRFAYWDGEKYVNIDGESEASITAALASGKFTIIIDVSKFPARNASVRAHIYFYYASQSENFVQYVRDDFADTSSGASSCFTSQTYAFTLPGIYRAGENEAFASEAVYNAIINTKNGENYVYDAYRKTPSTDGSYAFSDGNYLYVDGAAAVNGSLSFKGITESVDIRGVQLLTGTSELIFDDVPVTGVAGAFNEANTHITSLSMKNCGLDANILRSYLTNCRALTKISLSGNSLSGADLSGLLYRTVTTLDLSNCGLTSIDGISALPNLIKLELQNNAIKYFGELIDLSALKTVDVTGNVVENSLSHVGKILYGTAGEVNIPVYVYLLNVLEVKIINGEDKTNDTITVGNGVTAQQQLASLILTGVEYDRTFTGTIADNTFSKNVVWDGTTYTVSSVMVVGSDYAEKSTFAQGDAFYFVVSVTYGDTTCYALYAATYGGAS